MTLTRWLGTLTLLSLPARAGAQGVLVAPHHVFLDHQTRTASLLLYNPNTYPVEVSISTLFGYPVTDSLGRMTLRTEEQPDSSLPSAAAWILPFPKKMAIGAQERQTVRLLARPPAGLPDGEYWSRVIIAVKGGKLPVSGVSDTSSIQIGLNLEVRLVLSLTYRKGTLTSGLTMRDFRAFRTGDTLQVQTHLERQGTGAWLGAAHGTLADSTGRTRAEFKVPLGVYYAADPRFTLRTDSLPPGRYRLRLELVTDREDLAPDQLLQSPPVRDSAEVVLP